MRVRFYAADASVPPFERDAESMGHADHMVKQGAKLGLYGIIIGSI